MRSGSGLYIVIGILVVALLAFGGYTLTKNQSSPGTVINTGSPTPSVQNNSTEKSTPTTSKNKEDAVSLQGEVISYSECRVGPCPVGSMYMVIQPENDKEFGFDIYPETKIYFGDAVIVHISSIKVGQQVSVKGRTIDTAGPEDQTIADEVRILKST